MSSTFATVLFGRKAYKTVICHDIVVSICAWHTFKINQCICTLEQVTVIMYALPKSVLCVPLHLGIDPYMHCAHISHQQHSIHIAHAVFPTCQANDTTVVKWAKVAEQGSCRRQWIILRRRDRDFFVRATYFCALMQLSTLSWMKDTIKYWYKRQ